MSLGISIGRNISERNNHDPYFLETKFVCLPCQPKPADCASCFSKIGDVSTNTLESRLCSLDNHFLKIHSFSLIIVW